jgi:hypothetical protein
LKKVAAVGLLLALVLLATSASAGPAPAFKVALDRHALRSGQLLTATASSTRPCEWVLEWNGTRQHAIGTRFVATFTAPPVTRPRRIPLHALCVYGDPPRRTAGSPPARRTRDRSTIVVTVPDNWQDTIDVNVLPNGSVEGDSDSHGGGHSDGLPDTGGPSRWLATLGALLVLGGSQLIRRGSARSSVPS